MLKNKLTRIEVGELCSTLHDIVVSRQQDLRDATLAATNDPPEAFDHDYQTALGLLKHEPEKDLGTTFASRKPKGRILIMLSYNEPLIMSTDPIVAALIAGNSVVVRPSSMSADVFNIIWTPVLTALPWLKERLEILDTDYRFAAATIPTVQAVYFFGSQHVAKKIAIECAEHLVEFWPETEGADFAVYTDTAPLSPKEFAPYLLSEAGTHDGQICQRLQGVFVHETKYRELLQTLSMQQVSAANAAGERTSSQLQQQIRQQYDTLVAKEPQAIYLSGLTANAPSLISNINHGSPLCQTAFFLPSLWIVPYSTNANLLDIISQRPSQFGCNIWTSDEKVVNDIAQKTRLTRITVNTNHTEIRAHEGWGGSQPTSFGGYMQWSHKFTNAYTVLQSES